MAVNMAVNEESVPNRHRPEGCRTPPGWTSEKGRSAASAGDQAMRSSRCSPTRIAFAMAVSAGLTAPMLGNTLVSTT
jgi:hypothetical protein